jgi:hypothetical protein
MLNNRFSYLAKYMYRGLCLWESALLKERYYIMAISHYCFESFPDGSFAFYSDLNLLFNFTRLTFRDSFEAYATGNGLSSNWIGAMLR